VTVTLLPNYMLTWNFNNSTITFTVTKLKLRHSCLKIMTTNIDIEFIVCSM